MRAAPVDDRLVPRKIVKPKRLKMRKDGCCGSMTALDEWSRSLFFDCLCHIVFSVDVELLGCKVSGSKRGWFPPLRMVVIGAVLSRLFGLRGLEFVSRVLR